MNELKTNILRLLNSRWFFVAILVLFGLESVWIALSATYPMVFDENTHFGIIQLYAHQWSPFFAHQPANSGFAGQLTHNPSFLYEYLMSFPYRVLTHITSSQTTQIITLRLINIVLFGLSLPILRRLLLKLRISRPITHLTLLFFVLIPVVPLLAAEINYDNLVMPIVSLLFLSCVVFLQRLEHKELAVGLLFTTLTLGMLGSMVQYEVLPLLVAIVIGLAAVMVYYIWRQGLRLSQAWDKLRHSPWHHRLLIGVPFVIALGLFVRVYAVNVILYHNPNPSCSVVLTDAQCAANSTWARNVYNVAHRGVVNPDPIAYAGGWAYRLLNSMFYTSSGGAPHAYYLSINPLPILFVAAIVLGGLGLVLAALYWRKVFGKRLELAFLLLVSGFYLASLFAHTYAEYLVGGQKIGINGRYVFPVLVVLLVTAALGYQQWLGRHPARQFALLGMVCLVFIQGGGALTYITQSDAAWYWHSPLVQHANAAAQDVFGPLVVDKKPLSNL